VGMSIGHLCNSPAIECVCECYEQWQVLVHVCL